MNANETSVAEIILSQLGGAGRLTAMIGAHSFTSDGPALCFKFKAKAKNKAKAVKVTLASDDTYTLEMWSMRGLDCKKVTELDGLYCDNLKRAIESETGLYLSI
jgi:hypothetical protein